MTALLETRLEALERKMDLFQKEMRASLGEIVELLKSGEAPAPAPPVAKHQSTALQGAVAAFSRSMKTSIKEDEKPEIKQDLTVLIDGVRRNSYHSLYYIKPNAPFKEKLIAYMKVPIVFYPDTPLRRALHTVLTVAMVAEFAEVTVMAIYCNPFTKSNVRGLTAGWVLASFFWSIELIMRFFTPYFEKYTIRDMREDLPVIRKRYVNSLWFWFDLVIIIPWDLIFLATTDRKKYSDFNEIQCAGLFDTKFVYSFVHWIRAIRIFRFGALFGNRDPLTPDSKYVTAVKVVMIVFVVLHVTAMVCLLTTAPEERGSDPDINSESTIEAYSRALLWAIQTPVHGTYIIPTQLRTRIITFVIVIVGLAANLTLAAFLAAFFVVNDPFESMKNDRKQRLVSILHSNHVPWEIQKKVHNAYPLVYDHLLKEYNDVLSDLPKDLEEEVRKHIRIHALRRAKKIGFLREEVIEALSLVCTMSVTPTGTYVSGATHDVILVLDGLLKLELKDEPEKTLTEGAIFGNYLQSTMVTRAKAIRTVNSARVPLNDFKVLMQNFPELEQLAVEFVGGRPAVKYRDSLAELVQTQKSPSTVRESEVGQPAAPRPPDTATPKRLQFGTDRSVPERHALGYSPAINIYSEVSSTNKKEEETEHDVWGQPSTSAGVPGAVPPPPPPSEITRSSIETVRLRNDDVFTPSGYPRWH